MDIIVRARHSFENFSFLFIFELLQDLKVLKCRGCRLQNINPQLYNLLNQLTDLDLGNNQVIYFDSVSALMHICLIKLPHICLITERQRCCDGLNDLSIISHVKINATITPFVFFVTQGSMKFMPIQTNPASLTSFLRSFDNPHFLLSTTRNLTVIRACMMILNFHIYFDLIKQGKKESPHFASSLL